MGTLRQVIRISSVVVLTACGSNDGKKSDSAPVESKAEDPWDVVHVILQKNCGACHSDGAKHTQFVDNQELFVAAAAAVTERLNSTDAKVVMPPPRTRGALSEEDRKTVLDFLNQGDK